MNVLSLFTKGGAVNKAIDVIDKTVLDKTQATQAKFEVYQIIAASSVAKYVRALIAVLFVVVWLFFPEKFEGREKMSEYFLYAVVAFYFLVDKAADKIFSRKVK